MSRGPDPLRLIIVAAVLAIIGVQVNSWLRKQSPTRVPFASGTSHIAGRVVDALGRPIANARVVAQSSIPARSGGASTSDADGRFTIRDLAGGQFLVQVTKTGYLRGTFGEITPGTGHSLVVLDGDDEASDVTVTLWSEASMSGRVLDRNGRPAEGCSVGAMSRSLVDPNKVDWPEMRSSFAEAPRTTGRTNADGEFALTGLAGGPYVIAANCGGSRLARVYYPRATTWASAETIDLRPGEARTGVDVQLTADLPVTTLEGTIVGPDGSPLVAQVGLVARVGTIRTSSDQKGYFRFDDVPQGEYWIAAEGSSTSAKLWGTMPVSIGKRAAPLTLTLGASGAVRAKVSTATATEGAQPERAWVSLSPADSGSRMWLVPAGYDVQMDSSGIGVLTDVPPGRYVVLVRTENQPAWRVESLLCDGRDCLDRTIEVAGGQTVRVEAALTDVSASVSGRLVMPQSSNGAGWVIVFADDPPLRTPRRRVQMVRAHSGGRYVVTDLPAGAYRVAAVRTLTVEDWQSPEFLDRLAPQATLVQIGHAERKSLDLTAIAAIPAGGR